MSRFDAFRRSSSSSSSSSSGQRTSSSGGNRFSAFGRSSGGRGGVAGKRAERDKLVAQAEDAGLFDKVKGAMETPMSAVGTVLSWLDIPRAVVVSGVKEASDAANAGMDAIGVPEELQSVIVGGSISSAGRLIATPSKGMDAWRLEGDDASIGDFIDQIRSHYGFGDLIRDTGGSSNNEWVDRALGFTGDVLADPLTYVSFGGATAAKSGAKGAVKGGAKLLSKEQVAARIEDAAQAGVLNRKLANELQETALTKGVGALDDDILDLIGVRTGATFGFGQSRVMIPGTRRLAKDVTRAGGAVRRVARKAAELPGIRKVPEAFEALPGLNKIRQTRGARTAWAFKKSYTDGVDQASADVYAAAHELKRLKDTFGGAVSTDDLRRAMEGTLEPIDTLGSRTTKASLELADWFARRRQELIDAGIDIGNIENYLPHRLTDEYVALLKSTDGKVGRVALPQSLRRELRPGARWMGEELKEGTIDELNRIAREKLGNDFAKAFVDDPWKLAEAYLNDMHRALVRGHFVRNLVRMGVAMEADVPAIEQALKRSNKFAKRAAKAGTKAAAKEEEALKTRQRILGLEVADSIRRPTDEELGAMAGAEARAAQLEAEAADLANQAMEMQARLERAVRFTEAPEAAAEAPLRAAQDTPSGIPREVPVQDEWAAVEARWRQARAELDELDRQIQEAAQRNQAVFRQAREAEKQADAAQAQLRRIEERLRRLDERMENLEARGRDTSRLEAEFDELLAQRDELRKVAQAAPEAPPELMDVSQLTEAWKVKAREVGKLKVEADRIAKQQRMNEARAAGIPEDKVQRLERNVEALAKTEADFDAAGAARRGAENARKENELGLIELRERLERATGQRRAKLEEAAALRRDAERLFTAADQEADRAMAEIARLEALAAKAEADALQFRRRANIAAERALLEMPSAEDLDNFHTITTNALREFSDGRWAEPEVAQAFKEWMEGMTPEKVGSVLKTYDTLLSRWKAQSLLSPGFHIRNLLGGMFNNSLAGMDSKLYWRHLRFVTAMRRGGLEAAMKADAEYGRLFQEAAQYQIVHSFHNKARMQVRDLGDIQRLQGAERGALDALGLTKTRTGKGRILREGTTYSLDPTSLEFLPFQLNWQIAGNVENTLRIPLYVDRRMAGASVEEALETVRKFHFDYDDLSRFERRVARRVFPFYTWTRKNFPLQIEMMMRNPGRYTAFLHAKRNIELGTEEEDVVPSYYANLLAIRTPFTVGGAGFLPFHQDVEDGGEGNRIYLTVDMPFRDLSETLNFGTAAGQLSPFLKVPLELAAGRQFYSDVPFKEGSQQYTEVPAAWRPLVPFFMAAEKVPGIELPTVRIADDGRVLMSDRDAYKVEQMLPLLGRLRRMFPSEERYQERVTTSWLSTLGGISTATNNDSSKWGELHRQVKEIEDILADHELMTGEELPDQRSRRSGGNRRRSSSSSRRSSTTSLSRVRRTTGGGSRSSRSRVSRRSSSRRRSTSVRRRTT